LRYVLKLMHHLQLSRLMYSYIAYLIFINVQQGVTKLLSYTANNQYGLAPVDHYITRSYLVKIFSEHMQTGNRFLLILEIKF